ncbi:glutaminase A [Pararhodonellum marinum]|uniref:glutaminase A n=1 Tax=Pararhodonellum marinum TaxID=2755358 RepID=UPI00188FC2F6|nr:glutaminase A [Pararhodonellum marinum]
MKTEVRSFGILKLILLSIFVFSICLDGFAQRKSWTDDEYKKALKNAFVKFKDYKEGANANYIPELDKVDPELFGLAIVTVDGKIFTEGNLDTEISIQSISKVFTMARVVEDAGPQEVLEKVGVDATGMVFNSIIAVEMNKGKEINPLVNPGAIATTSMVKGDTYEEKWNLIKTTFDDFAGRKLNIDQPVYESEAATNQRNQAIAMLLNAYERMYYDPFEATDIYTKQCAIAVNAKDLAVMAATLANGGTNPLTKKKVVSYQTVAHVIPVMATAGLYDDTGQWIYNVGLPGKSGVGGGIIAFYPGQFGIAVISPRLDAAGNSVRAQESIKHIVAELGSNPFYVQPKN